MQRTSHFIKNEKKRKKKKLAYFFDAASFEICLQ